MKRKYYVTFGFGTKFSLRYVVMFGDSKDDVYGRACAVYGFMNVAGVHTDTPYNVQMLRAKGFQELRKNENS